MSLSLIEAKSNMDMMTRKEQKRLEKEYHVSSISSCELALVRAVWKLKDEGEKLGKTAREYRRLREEGEQLQHG